jgi:protein-S-isoprenylcysteine O-methyltransferase Ste14
MSTIADSLFFKLRGKVGVVLFAPVCIALLFSSPVIPGDSVFRQLAEVCGWIFFMTYVSSRLWATLYVGGRKDSELQTAGPYSVTRNPLYFGTFCFVTSLVFFFQSLTLLAVVLLGLLFYAQFVIKAEEKLLLERFGAAFEQYCKDTPRFLPSFSHFHSPPAIVVNLRDLKSEAKRLWTALLLPLAVIILLHFRYQEWWPHLFKLP